MGIPHLITYLRPFATRESLKDKEIVIDGPGLAYHIYHLCQSTRVSAGNYFEAVPSYKELGETVLEWLDGLEKGGSTVKRIYFDGYLPASKFDVRLERLGGNTKQLHDYYNQYPDGLRYQSSSTARQKPSSFPFGFVYPRNSYTKLPALPFLVAACIEALQGSNSYRDIVEMVPGEADAFCASYLSKHGGIVLTGDSDLLVHDLGANGSVTFFKDVEVALENVAEGLSTLRMAFQHLDTRICEYILQFPYLMSKLGEGQDISDSKETTDIFLPFLIDSPAKTNAWEMSTSIRQLAYACVNLVVPAADHKYTVFEHRRQLKTSRGREWEVPSPADLPEACGNIIIFLENVQHDLLDRPSINFWLAVAFTQDVNISSTLGKTALSKQLLSSSLSRKKNQMSWDRIHWTAQIHGSYYSFRILKQIIGFVVAVGDRATLPETLLRLHGLLQSLPNLLVSQVDDIGNIEELRPLATKPSPDELVTENDQGSFTKQKVSSKKSKKNKKKRKREQTNGGEKEGVRSNNPFDLLTRT
ncbi:hypothetical protein CJF32_00010919 [Rutstroemia sp. NJR-2017a WRK4]|nr:hypothetical protein CJF32_00010919 [Rutstroemia sp. NJR-2017a WRK4]